MKRNTIRHLFFKGLSVFLAIIMVSGCSVKKEGTVETGNRGSETRNSNRNNERNDRVVVEKSLFTLPTKMTERAQKLGQRPLEDLLDAFYKHAVQVKTTTIGEGEDEEELISTSVNYAGLKKNLDAKNPELVDLHHAILTKFAGSNIYAGRNLESRFAVLLNAYNYFMILTILENYDAVEGGIMSLEQIPEDRQIYLQKNITLGRRKVSLTNLFTGRRDSILSMTSFRDPRVLFAINHGSKDGPIVMNQAFRGSLINVQLSSITQLNLKHAHIAKNFNAARTTIVAPFFYSYRDIFRNSSLGGVSAFLQSNGFALVYDRIRYYAKNQQINQSENNGPISWDLSGVLIPDVEPDHRCSEYVSKEGQRPLAICDTVREKRLDRKYRYEVEYARICIITEKAFNNKTNLRIVGEVEEFSDTIDEQKTSIDFRTSNFNFNEDTGIINFKNSDIIISEGSLNTRESIFTLKQKFKTWSRHFFHKKKQRYFSASCEAIKNEE